MSAWSDPRSLKLKVLGTLLLLVMLGGCATAEYLGQAVAGHLRLMSASQPIDHWLEQPDTPAALKQKLQRAREMRVFASSALGLPDNRSYTGYADLGRSAVVWNVFATPELSLQLKTWCYPFFGCAGYRGYFDIKQAQALAAELREAGDDVYVAPVPAYSTLGWLNWAGGDPLLNTFIDWPEPELARLIFHELAHQVVYVKDDTVFNESFATAVERIGVRRWLAQHGDEAQRKQWTVYERRRGEFLSLVTQCRDQLQALYASDLALALKRERKQEVLVQLQEAGQTLQKKYGWGGRFFSPPLGGAHLASVAAYNDDVTAFEVLLEREQQDLPRFYAAVKQLAALPAAQRRAALIELNSAAAVKQ